MSRPYKNGVKNKSDNDDSRESGTSHSTTITPTSSQDEGQQEAGGPRTPPRTTSGGVGRFRTRTSDDRKPWERKGGDVEDSGGVRRSLDRTTSSDQGHILHGPPSRQNNNHQNDDSKNEESRPMKSFDDLWDESVNLGGDQVPITPAPPGPLPPPPAATKSRYESPSEVNSRKLDKEVDTSKFREEVDTSKFRKEVDTSRFQKEVDSSKVGKEVDASKSGKEVDTSKFRKEVDTSRFHKDADTSKVGKEVDTSKSSKEVDTSKFRKEADTSKVGKEVDTSKSGKEVDTSRFAKGSRAPPNTPENTAHLTTAKESSPPVQRKEHPIRHPRQPSTEKIPRRPNRPRKKEETPDITKNSDKKDDTADSEKPKHEYKNPDEAIASLEKQLDRVTFLQKRQFDQLSSMKKMLLASRGKEKEHAKAGAELKVTVEKQNTQIAQLQVELKKSQSAATSTVAETRIGGTNNGAYEKQLQEKDAKIAELQRQLQEMETKHSEQTTQMENALAIAESKLRKKSDQAEKLHEEMEGMREQLTTANSTIEQLEEERNFSRAKMSELNDMMNQKGGLSDNESELLERAAEISNLTSKLSAMDGKLQDRDDKLFKLEEDIKGVNDLVKQLSDAFVGEDQELRKHQDLLIESASSPTQTSTLLLMTMMNMLDSLKEKLNQIQKERDDINAKAADRGIQLAESHIRVDKLRTELRRMRGERERARAGRGGRGPSPLASADNPGLMKPPQPPLEGDARPRHASHTAAPVGSPTPRPPSEQAPSLGNRWSAIGSGMGLVRGNSGEELNGKLPPESERSQKTAPATAIDPPQRPSRFMSFLKGNLTQEAASPERNGRSPSRGPQMIATK